MFVAHKQRVGRLTRLAEINDNEDMLLRSYCIHPTIDELRLVYFQGQLLFQFPAGTRLRCLIEFEPSSGKLPFVAFVEKQGDSIPPKHHGLYRNSKQMAVDRWGFQAAIPHRENSLLPGLEKNIAALGRTQERRTVIARAGDEMPFPQDPDTYGVSSA